MHKGQRSESLIVFEQNRQEGGDGNWVKKFQEHGGSKNQFLKEMSGGKKVAYLRPEIKKALQKETPLDHLGSSGE